jgi:signal transduction histidine kinase
MEHIISPFHLFHNFLSLTFCTILFFPLFIKIEVKLFFIALVMTLLPWSIFPSLKTAFYSSMGVGIVSAMICFYFEYLTIKDERIRLEEKNKELAVVEERNRIARELHDSVSQSLFGISLNLNTLELILESQPAKAKALIGQVKEMVEEAQREMRLMIYGLQPSVLRRELTTGRSWLYTGLSRKRCITSSSTPGPPRPRFPSRFKRGKWWPG